VDNGMLPVVPCWQHNASVYHYVHKIQFYVTIEAVPKLQFLEQQPLMMFPQNGLEQKQTQLIKLQQILLASWYEKK